MMIGTKPVHDHDACQLFLITGVFIESILVYEFSKLVRDKYLQFFYF